MRPFWLRSGFLTRWSLVALMAPTALVAVGAGCSKQGPLPGQSEVPPPGYGDAETGSCNTAVKEGSTLLASNDDGWGVVLPGDAWELDCSNPARVSAKLSSSLGESLLFTASLAEAMPENEREHLDAIHVRAKKVLPQAGARLVKPRFIVARASPKTDEKTVFVYQVMAEAFERQKMVSYHGWSLLRNDRGAVFECHLNATSRKQLDWPNLIAKVLSSCIGRSP